MPQQATPNMIEVQTQIGATVGSGPHYNIWHLAIVGEPGPNIGPILAKIAAFYNIVKSYYPAGTSIQTGFKVIDRRTVPWQFVTATPVVTTGTGTGGYAPAQLAAVVTWRTADVGRSYRGRTFLGPIGMAGLAGANLDSGFVTAIGGAAANLILDLDTATVGNLVVYSHKHNTYSLVTSSGTTSVVRTIRSRAVH